MADSDGGIHLPGSILPLSPSLAGSAPIASTDPDTTTSASVSHSHAGAIAGGVIGGVALLLALIGVYLYYRQKRRATPYQVRQRRSSVSAVSPHKAADSFNGTDTLVDDYASKSGAKRSGSYVSKAGGYDSTTSIGHGRPSMGYEDDRARTPSTLHGHKSLESTEEIPVMPLDYIPSLPPNVAQADGRTRSKSVTDHNRAVALAALDGNDSPSSWNQYPPYSPSRHSTDARMSGSRPSSMVMLGRSDSMTRSGNRTSRRATRKAVPKYDDADLSNPASPTYPPTSPATASDFRDEVRASYSAGNSNANLPAQMSRSRENLVAAGYEVPELNHKSSFGNKAMHYLIPDPPPRQVD
jgi:hypothetical protein